MPVKFLILCVKEPCRKSWLIEFSLRRRNAFIQVGATARPARSAKPCRNFPSAQRLMIFPDPRNWLGIIVRAGTDRTWKLRTCCETAQFLMRASARVNTSDENVRLFHFNVFAASVFSSFANNNLPHRTRTLYLFERTWLYGGALIMEIITCRPGIRRNLWD